MNTATESNWKKVSGRAYRSGNEFAIESGTRSGKWWHVVDGQCDCPGFGYRGSCNHIDHLLREGFLVPDRYHGQGYILAEEPKRNRAWERQTGIRSTPEKKPEESQVRRLQKYLLKQDALLKLQREAISAAMAKDERKFRALVSRISGLEDELLAYEKSMPAGDFVELTGVER